MDWNIKIIHKFVNESMNKRKKIIVVGAGFAGVQFARKLDERLFDILLIDKLNPKYYLFMI